MSETSRKHKEEAPEKLAFTVITVSSSRFQAQEARMRVVDESGDLIVEALKAAGHSVFVRQLVPDSRGVIEAD